jgi:phosphoenolpyruvate carboxylase
MPEPDRTPEHLPPGLRETVGVVEAILGQVVARAEGTALFDAVEGIRRHMVAFREAASDADREAALDRAADMLAGLSLEEKTALARAYTLYLQLVNVCEHAYRTHRLHRRPGRDEAAAARARLTFVLTAHPTESRSPGNIRVLRRVQDHVIESLAKDRPVDRAEIENLIHLAWRIGTHPPRKPSVEDEANHLFSLLTDPILSEVIALTEAGHSVLFRSWVGGDKDGHPDVGPPQTEAAMSLARGRLLAFVEARSLEPVRRDVALAGGRTVESALVGLEDAVSGLATVSDGDGGRVAALRPLGAVLDPDPAAAACMARRRRRVARAARRARRAGAARGPAPLESARPLSPSVNGPRSP